MTTTFGRAWSVGLAVLALLVGGCTIARQAPLPPSKFGEVESEERGEVVAVNDTMIDMRFGIPPAGRTRTPMIPIGRAGVSVPVTVGGEGRNDVPAEEITVRLVGNKIVTVVQPLSHPAFAPGERVLVQKEKPNIVTSESRIRVVRDEDPTPGRIGR